MTPPFQEIADEDPLLQVIKLAMIEIIKTKQEAAGGIILFAHKEVPVEVV